MAFHIMGAVCTAVAAKLSRTSLEHVRRWFPVSEFSFDGRIEYYMADPSSPLLYMACAQKEYDLFKNAASAVKNRVWQCSAADLYADRLFVHSQCSLCDRIHCDLSGLRLAHLPFLENQISNGIQGDRQA